MRAVIQSIRRAMLLHGGGGLTDRQLLECFIERQDHDAFEALVRLHGPMVFGVCSRILAHHQDAEEAFQATFLVLARKGDSLTQRESLSSWLYGVALRTARKAKSLRARRRLREQAMTTTHEPCQVSTPNPWSEVSPFLDDELARLPEKYRTAIVLCDLEGKTHKEASQLLGL